MNFQGKYETFVPLLQEENSELLLVQKGINLMFDKKYILKDKNNVAVVRQVPKKNNDQKNELIVSAN